MYKHEIDKILKEGEAVRRAAWPKSAHIVNPKHSGVTVSVDDNTKAALGLKVAIEPEISDDLLLYVHGKTTLIVGFKLTPGDLKAQDWEKA